MAFRYALSDPHGSLELLECALAAVDLTDPASHLYLLGDYIPHRERCADFAEFLERSRAALRFVQRLCEANPAQVTALRGNHEQGLAEELAAAPLSPSDRRLVSWAARLPLFAETEAQIFVHAGIDEMPGWWRACTPDETFLMKYPASIGSFEKDIIAGHVGTHAISGMPGFHGALHDGRSHYYIDGSTELSGTLPLLRFDTARRRYEAWNVRASDVEAARILVCDELPDTERDEWA